MEESVKWVVKVINSHYHSLHTQNGPPMFVCVCVCVCVCLLFSVVNVLCEGL